MQDHGGGLSDPADTLGLPANVLDAPKMEGMHAPTFTRVRAYLEPMSREAANDERDASHTPAGAAATLMTSATRSAHPAATPAATQTSSRQTGKRTGARAQGLVAPRALLFAGKCEADAQQQPTATYPAVPVKQLHPAMQLFARSQGGTALRRERWHWQQPAVAGSAVFGEQHDAWLGKQRLREALTQRNGAALEPEDFFRPSARESALRQWRGVRFYGPPTAHRLMPSGRLELRSRWAEFVAVLRLQGAWRRNLAHVRVRSLRLETAPDPTALPSPPARWIWAGQRVLNAPTSLAPRRSGGRQRRGARRARQQANRALRWPDSEWVVEHLDDQGRLVCRYDGFAGILV